MKEQQFGVQDQNGFLNTYGVIQDCTDIDSTENEKTRGDTQTHRQQGDLHLLFLKIREGL
jgi:hypothetical protein